MEQKEKDIQTLLKAINDELENDSLHSDSVFLSPSKNTFLTELGFDYEYLIKLLNICEKRGLLKVVSNTWTGSYRISLTHAGQEKALECNNKDKIPSMNINFNGPTQIGNGNVQNFSNFISLIEAKINEASASDAEKKEAKNLLVKLTENPLVSSIIGGLISGLV